MAIMHANTATAATACMAGCVAPAAACMAGCVAPTASCLVCVSDVTDKRRSPVSRFAVSTGNDVVVHAAVRNVCR